MRALLSVLVSTLAVLAGCAAPAQGPPHITVWTGDTIPERVAATRAIIDRFTAQTGIQVTLRGVDEDDFSRALTEAAEAGELPDVVASQPIAALRTLYTTQVLNTDAAAQVVTDLHPGTFYPRALELTQADGLQLAVPSDSWVQLLYYRKDLFDQSRLAAPDTFQTLEFAARTLGGGHVVSSGIALPTTAGDNFTQQVFEAFALSNDCQMVGPDGGVTLDSAQCVSALSYYTQLVGQHGAPGVQDVDSVRREYLAGGTAMVVWSTFLLDELGGLRDNVRPTCGQCREDPGYLARNTAVVPLIEGPLGARPGQFGEINSWAILSDADAVSATRFVEWLMTDGYAEWLAFAPEGKYPARLGPVPGSTEYIEAWRQSPVGVDRKALLRDLFPPESVAALEGGLLTMNQWEGDLVGASLGELPVAQAVFEATVGGSDPRTALRKAAGSLREIQSTLPRGRS